MAAAVPVPSSAAKPMYSRANDGSPSRDRYALYSRKARCATPPWVRVKSAWQDVSVLGDGLVDVSRAGPPLPVVSTDLAVERCACDSATPSKAVLSA
eukprot:scaffold3031_cov28-Tisochrysis_lutea.AAC.4